MDKELEEAIEEFKREYDDSRILGGDLIINLENAKILLNYIENSIPKEVVEEKIEQLKQYILNLEMKQNEIIAMDGDDLPIRDEIAIVEEQIYLLQELLQEKGEK